MNFIAPETSDFRAIQPPSPEHVQDESWRWKQPPEPASGHGIFWTIVGFMALAGGVMFWRAWR